MVKTTLVNFLKQWNWILWRNQLWKHFFHSIRYFSSCGFENESRKILLLSNSRLKFMGSSACRIVWFVFNFTLKLSCSWHANIDVHFVWKSTHLWPWMKWKLDKKYTPGQFSFYPICFALNVKYLMFVYRNRFKNFTMRE